MPGRSERQNLPELLARLFEEIHEIVGLLTKIPDAPWPG